MSTEECRRRQTGTASIEFALTITVFFLLTIGALEFGRVVFAWNAVAEATRAGARTASVSPIGATKVQDSMRSILAALQDSQIVVDYLPAGCNPDTCELIKVSITDYAIAPLLLPVAVLPVPQSSTTVQREGLGVI